MGKAARKHWITQSLGEQAYANSRLRPEEIRAVGNIAKERPDIVFITKAIFDWWGSSQ